MLNNFEICILIISVLSLTYIIINNKIGFKMKKQYCTTQYRNQYFYSSVVNKHPFLFIFCAVFLLMYYKKHKDEYEYGYDLYMLTLIEDAKHLTNFSKFDYQIVEEDIIRKRITVYERKTKLKNINKFGKIKKLW